ncbi:hypothetical protein NGC49_02070 [Enterobacter vonholyi]|uniref:hypothetical protein n=1 Tax=Enterobacter vonholyi TaxID=2797505 RepID=UPI002DBE619E|nr:hypothetical protein [Enterobacter vonholyi]MEB7622510.1 hypothetical protein [Enterobacter vonholyi]
MKNTQIVAKLQPHMTREQLIDAARKAAPLLPPAYGWMVNELATRLDVTSVALCEALAQRKELAEQNATLRGDVANWAKECDHIEERHTKTPTNMHLLEAQRELHELAPVVISLNKEVAL